MPGCANWCQEPRSFCGDNEEMDKEAIGGGDEGGPLLRRSFSSRGFGRGMLACLLVGAGLASVSGADSTLEGPDKFTILATPLEWRMWSTMPNTGDAAQACPHPYLATLPQGMNISCQIQQFGRCRLLALASQWCLALVLIARM